MNSFTATSRPQQPQQSVGAPAASLIMTNIDCAKPAVLGRFYADLLGWKVLHSHEEYAMVGDGATAIGFGQVEHYTAPTWPDERSAKQFHLDFYVDDIDAAAAWCVAHGGNVPEFQPEGTGGESYSIRPGTRCACVCGRMKAESSCVNRPDGPDDLTGCGHRAFRGARSAHG